MRDQHSIVVLFYNPWIVGIPGIAHAGLILIGVWLAN